MKSGGLGPALALARRGKGLTQRDLADKAGTTQAHVSRIENGLVDVQLSSLVDLARFLDLELVLAPRAMLPAIEAMTQRAAPQPLPKSVEADLRRLARAAIAMKARAETLFVADELDSAIAGLRRAGAGLNTEASVARIRQSTDQVEAAMTLLAKPKGNSSNDIALHALRQSVLALNEIRNTPAQSAAPRPAFRLDDSEEG